MDDHKMKEKMEEMKSKAKAFMKNISSPFGSVRSAQTFKGQGHRLGGTAEPSFSSPPPYATPSPRTADGSCAGHSNSSCGGGGGAVKKLGSPFSQQKQQQSDLRRSQQEKWERERGIAPVPASRQCRGTVSPNSAHTLRAQEHVLQSGGTLASAAASVKSPTPDDSLRVERESIGTVQVGNMAPNYSPLQRPGLENPSHFDPYSPIIASGTSHRPGIGTHRATDTKSQFQCPICQKWWQSEAQVSAHIDDCTGVGNPEIAGLSLAQDATTTQGVRQWESEGSVPVDLDEAVAIFLSGGPSNATTEVILKLFRNILNAPNEEKFWTLRMGNPKIKETIGSAIGGLRFLESVGFRSVEGGEKFSLIEKPSIERLDQIQAAIAYLESHNSAKEAPVMISQPSHEVPNNLNPVNRQLRIFYASKDHLEDRFELPDSFYNLSGAELKNEAAARRKKLEDSQLLIPKSFREKQAAVAKRRYKLTVVRVQLPDGLVVQGFFHPDEPTSALYEFVASTLKDGHETFDLVLPAAIKHRVIPRFPDGNGRCVTMEETDLVPKALLKFNPTGPQGYTCLKNEYYALCEPLKLTTLLEPGDFHKR